MKSTCVAKTVAVKLYSDKSTAKNNLIGEVSLPEFEEMPQVLIVGEDVFVAEKAYYRGDYKYVRMDLIHTIDPGQIQEMKRDDDIANAEGGAA